MLFHRNRQRFFMNKIQLIDILTGKNVWPLYKLYSETQWYSKSQMRAFQLEKLKKLLLHCKENIPYYQDIIERNKINIESIQSFDVLHLFPILTKEILKDNYKEFIPKNIKSIKGVKTSQTGGTTGNILLKRTDSNVRSSTWATYTRFHDWIGINSKSKVLSLMGGHIIKHNKIHQIKISIDNYLNNIISHDPYDKSDKNIERIIKTLNNNKFDLIRAYSQSLFFLANVFKSRGLKFDIPAITTTAEPLMHEHRILFEEIFGAQSFDQYGCGEIGGIAYECDHHQGLHVAEERVIIEVKDRHDLIITDLDNYAMPFIRYWNADQAVFTQKTCTCGRESMMVEKIMGRTCDYMSCSDGKQLHWAFFWHLLFDTKIAINRNMKKFQVLQKSQNEIDFRIVSDQLSEEDKITISHHLKIKMGPDLKIKFIQEDDIENAISGKFRPVINNTI